MKHRFLSGGIATLVFLSVVSVFAQDFRIDNEVRNDGETVQSTTFFLQERNFLNRIGENGEISHFDGQTEVYTLVDPQLRIQTQLAGSEMKKRIEDWRLKSVRSQTPLVAFAASAKFQEEYEQSSGALSLQSPWIDYRLETEAFADEQIARRYAAFCDWTCYLNFRLEGHASPMPIIRLEVNRILSEKKRFPKSMTVSFYPKGKGLLAKEVKATSKHTLVLRLSDEDKKRIVQAKDFMRTFTMVPFSEYQTKVRENAERK